MKKMTLRIRPVKLKQSVYFRVPSDIADLIGLDPNAEVTLNLEEQDEQFLLIYSVNKSPLPKEPQPSRQPPRYPKSETEHLAPIPTTQRARSIEDEE